MARHHQVGHGVPKVILAAIPCQVLNDVLQGVIQAVLYRDALHPVSFAMILRPSGHGHCPATQTCRWKQVVPLGHGPPRCSCFVSVDAILRFGHGGFPACLPKLLVDLLELPDQDGPGGVAPDCGGGVVQFGCAPEERVRRNLGRSASLIVTSHSSRSRRWNSEGRLLPA